MEYNVIKLLMIRKS